MNILFLDNIITSAFARALCWTLIHSLWMGAATVLLAAMTLYVCRRSSAALRYNLLVGILGMFILTICVVFYRQIDIYSQIGVGATASARQPTVAMPLGGSDTAMMGAAMV